MGMVRLPSGGGNGRLFLDMAPMYSRHAAKEMGARGRRSGLELIGEFFAGPKSHHSWPMPLS